MGPGPTSRTRPASTLPFAPLSTLVATLVAALILGGCSVTVRSDSDDKPSTSTPTSLLHDDRLTLDLTRRPTREGFGLREDRNYRFYQRSGPMITTTVKLPTGTFTTPAFQVSGATTAGGGADDHTEHEHAPKYFDVLAVYDSAADAIAALRDQAKVLGIATSDIDAISGDLGTGTPVTQSRVLRGLVQDWLSVQVTLSDTDPESGSTKDTAVQLDYELDVDVYHNAAVDQIVRDDTVAVDLTGRPTRAALGFLPTYPDATVNAPPGRRYTFAFTTAHGTFEVPSDSMVSGAAGGSATGEPEASTITASGAPDALRSQLVEQADVLGVARSEIEAAFAGGQRRETTLNATPGDHYRLALRVDVDPSRSDAYAASVQYRLTYS